MLLADPAKISFSTVSTQSRHTALAQ